MKVLYYTLFIGFILLATIFLYYALRPVPLPAEVSESPDASWHFVDPQGGLKSLMPGPEIVRKAIRSIHVAGEGTRPLLVEMQTRLPAWLTGWVKLPGWRRCTASGWDLCFTRAGVSGRMKAPRRGSDIYGWMKTSPPLTFSLEGENPFRFESFCPAPAAESEREVGDRRLDLSAFAGESPHLRLALPGMDLKWIRLAPGYGDVSFRYHGKSREISFGNLEGMAASEKIRASLYLHYKRSQILQNPVVPDAIRRSPVVEMVDALDVECHPRDGGEACSGRISLTFKAQNVNYHLKMHKGFFSLADFPKEGIFISENIPLEAGMFPEDLVSALDDIRVEMRITGGEPVFHLSGRIVCRFSLMCGRCLEPFPFTGEVEILNMLQPAGTKDPGPEAFPYANDMFDLHGIVRELIELNLPMKPLCSENCRGICPLCGVNLNRAACACPPPEPDPCWEAIHKLKKGV